MLLICLCSGPWDQSHSMYSVLLCCIYCSTVNMLTANGLLGETKLSRQVCVGFLQCQWRIFRVYCPQKHNRVCALCCWLIAHDRLGPHVRAYTNSMINGTSLSNTCCIWASWAYLCFCRHTQMCANDARSSTQSRRTCGDDGGGDLMSSRHRVQCLHCKMHGGGYGGTRAHGRRSARC